MDISRYIYLYKAELKKTEKKLITFQKTWKSEGGDGANDHVYNGVTIRQAFKFVTPSGS